MNKPKHHIFVCSSSRLNGQQKGFCFSKDSVKVLEYCLEEVQDRELEGEVFVSNTGCLGVCNQGPIIVIYPEGVWYGGVGLDDVPEIFDAMEAGTVVDRLKI